MRFKGLGPEWFPVVLGTLSLSLAIYINYLIFDYNFLFILGKLIFFFAVIFYLFILFSWFYRYIKNKSLIKKDINNITSLSFTAFLGVLYFALAFFYIAYIGINRQIAYIFLYLYIFFYIFVLFINIILNYNLYANKYNFTEITYAILVPSIVLSANIILSSVLLTEPLSSYFSLSILKSIDFMVMVAIGISFFQFLFIGISAFISHINNKNYLKIVPAAMIPVGASSMLIINIMFLPSFNYIDVFKISLNDAIDFSILLFGFDLFLFLVSAVISLSNIRKRQSMTVWAYVFPVGISTFSDYMIYNFTKIDIFIYTIIIFTVALFILYIYSWINTYLILKYKN